MSSKLHRFRVSNFSPYLVPYRLHLQFKSSTIRSVKVGIGLTKPFSKFINIRFLNEMVYKEILPLGPTTSYLTFLLLTFLLFFNSFLFLVYFRTYHSHLLPDFSPLELYSPVPPHSVFLSSSY